MKSIKEYRDPRTKVSHPKNGRGNKCPQLVDHLINAIDALKADQKLICTRYLLDSLELLGIDYNKA